ncbi:MAG TPA: hypothetical protein VGE51_03940, partial [Fontimonas sp.]
KLTDTSDLARMLHRLSTSSEPLSGPTTSSPGSRASQAPAQPQPALDATMVVPKAAANEFSSTASRAATTTSSKLGSWVKDTLNKPIF